jgi:hypothetical protein
MHDVRPGNARQRDAAVIDAEGTELTGASRGFIHIDWQPLPKPWAAPAQV